MQARPLGALAAAVLSVGGVTLAATAQASSGVFVYTDAGTGLVNALVAPPERECIVAKGSGARNFTSSDVVLYSDDGCKRFLLALVPGESLNIAFSSLAFVPGAAAPRPRYSDATSVGPRH